MLISSEIIAEKKVNNTTVYVARCVYKDDDGYRRVDYAVEDEFNNYDVFKTKAKAIKYLNNL